MLNPGNRPARPVEDAVGLAQPDHPHETPVVTGPERGLQRPEARADEAGR